MTAFKNTTAATSSGGGRPWIGALGALWVALGVLGVLGLVACGGGSDGPAPEPLPITNALQATGRELDLGIVGQGAFILVHPQTGERLYSRLGRFDLDAQGRLVNNEGWLLAGLPPEYSTHAAGGLPPSVSPLPALPVALAAQATSTLRFEVALPANAPQVTGKPFNIEDPSTYNNATAMGIVRAHTLQSAALSFYFRRVGLVRDARGLAVASRWEIRFSLGASPVALPQAVLLDFKLPFEPPSPSSVVLKLPVEQGVGQAGSGTQDLLLDLTGLFESGGAYFPFSVSSDGRLGMAISRVSIDPQGQIWLNYTSHEDRNGEVSWLGYAVEDARSGGQLLLARFTVADRLMRTGSMWSCGAGCAAPLINLPGASLIGFLQARSINVDQ